MNEAELLAAKTIYDVAIQSAITAALATPYLSWLNIPVIRDIFNWIVVKIANLIYSQLEEGTVFLIISVRTQAQNNAYKAALENYKTTVTDQKTPEEISNAKQKLKDALRDLIRITH